MNFADSMKAMIEGEKVTRESWVGSIYFTSPDKVNVLSYQPILEPFHYDEDIMISNGWKIDNSEIIYRFYDIIPYLQQGARVRNSEWKEDIYIYYDSINKYLVIHQMKDISYTPDFESLIAQDWVII